MGWPVPAKCLYLVVASSLSLFQAPAVFSADSYAQAVSLYGAKRYAEAEKIFLATLSKKAISPGDADAHYYLASCYHYQRKFDQAKKEYLFVVKNFPNTQAAGYAKQGLAVLANPLPAAAVGAANATATASGAGAGTNYTPDEEWIPYSRGSGGHFYVKPVINGQQQEMIFDTGAEMTVMGTNQWKQLGMPIPTGPYNTTGTGVAGTVGMWQREVDISLGKIRKHMSLFVMDTPTLPGLLGENILWRHGIQHGQQRRLHSFLQERACDRG